MQTHNLTQGSPEWHEFRAQHFGASEAAAMLGLSQYMSRSELVEAKAAGKEPEHSDLTLSLFERGHEAEALARQIIEEEIGEELYPVTCSHGKLSASCDGLTLDGSIAFEHKLYNAQLAFSIRNNGAIPDEYMPQCQQILLVTGAERLIFVCSDGTIDNRATLEMSPDEKWQSRIISGWAQFEKDLADFVPKEIAEKPEPAAIMQLPALSIQIKGEVTTSNLPAFKSAAEAFIANINTDLQTDDDFANAEATVKFCDETEKKLDTAKSAAIAQTASIDELMRTIDFIKESIRAKRLTLEKLVKTQKESIKAQIIDNAYLVCEKHVDAIHDELCPRISFGSLASSILTRQRFEAACKNKRTLASLHNAADTETAAIKIAMNDLALVVRKNLAHLPNDLSLFRDLQSIITKPEDDFKLLAESRIAEQKRKEEEAAQRAIAAAKEIEEAEAKRIAAAQEEAARRKEVESAHIASLPTDIKSVIADEEKQLKEIEARQKNEDSIPRQRINELLAKERILDALIAAGVENWEGYDRAIESSKSAA